MQCNAQNPSQRQAFAALGLSQPPRERVGQLIKEAAVRMGADPKDVASHSLRAGGATALFNAGYTPTEIQMRGRWVSDCWLQYIWRGRETAKGVVEKMLSARFTSFN